ncbi:MAG TPA: SGNH/GDSL hydrolase family protein [Elusimicrobiales bacterium]|nr:SGNH/GDSL hydrolase family protein [Elusimicrobiales bacterium]
METSGKKYGSLFERNPVKTLLLVILVSALALDVLAANVYTLLNGRPWALRGPREDPAERTYRVHSGLYHHDLAKNKCAGNARWGDIVYKVCTNSLGFKDSGVRAVPLSSGRRRLLFIGDSFTEGLGVEYKDTFAGLIGAGLEKNGVEVLNAAVSGYSPVIYWKKTEYLVERAGLKFDEAVVFLDISDIEDEAVHYSLDENGSVAAIDAGKGGAGDRRRPDFKRILEKNSILVSELRRIALSLLQSPFHKAHVVNSRTALWTTDKEVYAEYGETGLKKCDLYMDKLSALLRKRGIKLTLAVYPWPDQIRSGDLDSIQVSHWKQWAAGRGAEFIDYFPVFITGKTEKEKQAVMDKYYLENDQHWNKNGHKLVAEVFLELYRARRGKAPAARPGPEL